jgi:hypothetical protein
MRAVEHSSENIGSDRISEEVKIQRSFNKKMLIAVLALVALIVGISIAVATGSSEQRIMAPGPIGSTDSIAQPVG